VVNPDSTPRNSTERISIRTERFRYYWWGSIALAIFLAGIKDVVEASRWGGLMLYLFTWSIVFLWLAGYRIIIDRDVLSYSEFAKSSVSVHRDDIVSAEVPAGRFEHSIVIKRRVGSPIIINTKPFSKNDLKIVIRFLADKMVDKPDWT
jgi:hypothetical protein